MITHLTIAAGTATFEASVPIGDLRRCNYFYGANGTGKTTISKILADPDEHPGSLITWTAGQPLATRVYNRDYVRKTFGDNKALPGIFTLGEGSAEVQKQLDRKREEQQKQRDKLAKLQASLGGELVKRDAAWEELRDAAWAVRKELQQSFKPALQGSGNKDRCAQAVLDARKAGSGTLHPLDGLTQRAAAVYGESVERAPIHPVPTADTLAELASHEILGRRIAGRTDVEIATLIERLGNADWVRQGRIHHDALDHEQCPFCQQPTRPELKEQLDAFFDASYERDVATLKDLAEEYRDAVTTLSGAYRQIKDQPGPFLDRETFTDKVALIGQQANANRRTIADKLDVPGTTVELQDLSPLIAEAAALLEEANQRGGEHNKLLDNRSAERTRLREDVWCFIVDRLAADLARYDKQAGAANKAIKGIQGNIDTVDKELRVTDTAIKELEKQVTSVKPTVDAINAILQAYEFTSFRLAEAQREGFYRVVRADGQDALDTLSEGERTLITFLYFYSDIQGSTSTSGVTQPRVVVFDDPISSLDSDVLFLVSSLVRRVVELARDPASPIEQVFVLTHNVYFHKEVTFDPSSKEPRKDESYWTVHKRDDRSGVQRHERTPVSTTYELLWQELRRPDCSVVSIQNTMRRILESYFKLLGGIPYAQVVDSFEGKDREVCRSLVRWINDGSHSAWDDVHAPRDGITVDRYKAVFEKIFDRLEHRAHYEMMMGRSGGVSG